MRHESLGLSCEAVPRWPTKMTRWRSLGAEEIRGHHNTHNVTRTITSRCLPMRVGKPSERKHPEGLKTGARSTGVMGTGVEANGSGSG